MHTGHTSHSLIDAEFSMMLLPSNASWKRGKTRWMANISPEEVGAKRKDRLAELSTDRLYSLFYYISCNLAFLEMRLIVAVLLSNSDLSLGESMEQ